jgi:PKD repeat protein
MLARRARINRLLPVATVVILALSTGLVAVSHVAKPADAATNGPVVLSNTSDKTVYESAFQNFGFYAQGRYWVFYEDTSFTCENMAGCLFFTSSPDGSSWLTPTNVGIHVTDSDWSIVTDSSHAYYVRYDENVFESMCGLPLLIGTGVLSSAGSISWLPEQTVKSGSPQDVYLNDVVKIDSSAQLWVGYQDANAGACGGTGSQTPQVIHSIGTDYASWTGDTVLSTAHSNNWDVDIAPLSGGEVYAAYWINSLDLHGRLFNGTTWGPDEQISYPSDSTDVNSFLFSSGTNLYAIWYDTNSETIRFGLRSALGQWSINNIGSGEARSGASLGRYSLPITATFDPSASNFYFYWFNTTNGMIDQWSGGGSSWVKTSGVFSTASETGEYTITSYDEASGVGNSDAFGVMWIDQPSLPYHLNFGLVTTSATTVSPLSASFTYAPSSPMVDQQVSFTASAVGGTAPYSYSWNFGDGATGAGQTVTHAYSSAGSFTVTMKAKDSGSPQQTSTAQQTVSIPSPPPGLSASFTYSPSSPQTGQQVSFTGSASGGSTPYTFSWSFGDGATGSGSSTAHTYSSAGSYTVTLTVKDSGSPQQSVTSQQTLSVVSPPPALTVSFSYSPSSPQTGEPVTFAASASGGTSPYSFGWSFGDGSTGSGSSVTHAYSSSGSYTVTMTVDDSGSPQQTATFQKTVTVTSPPPPPLSASFSYSPSMPLPLLPVTFTASASGGSGSYSFSWDFGDGSTGGGSTVSHSYLLPGSYTVTLTVTDSDGQSLTTSQTITVLTNLL